MASNGNPNNPRIPLWPSYETMHRSTLVFGDPTNVVNDPRREFREYWAARAAAASRDDG
jgi:para-nitrobenzyl esterase